MNDHSNDIKSPFNEETPSPSVHSTQDAPRRDNHKARGAQSASGFVRGALRLILPVVVIAVGGFVAWKLVVTKPEVDRRPPREKTYAVELRKAEPASIQPSLTLYGTVEASRQVDLRALVSGEVIWVNPAVAEGQVVDGGDALVRIDPFDYAGAVREAEANLAEARAKLTAGEVSLVSDQKALERLQEQLILAQNDFNRAETLANSGSLTQQALENRKLTLSQRQQTVESREYNLEVLSSQIEQQKANVARLDWKLEQARRNLSDTTLTAPFKGVVKAKSVELGRSVSGSDTLISLYDPDAMDVRFTLSDSQYGRLTLAGSELIGRVITVHWQLGEQSRQFRAVIDRVTPEINAANGGVEVYARLDADSNLRTGAFVALDVPDKVYKHAISIPQAAIYGGDLVYINKDGRMAPHKVKVLAYLGDNALIDGEGFAAGEEIVATRLAEAGPGLKLVVPGAENDKGTGKGQKVPVRDGKQGGKRGAPQ